MITHYDILKLLLYKSLYTKNFFWKNISVDDIFSINSIKSKNIILASPKDKIGDVITTSFQYDIREVPVIDNGVIVGIIKIKDMAREIIKIIQKNK